MTQTKVALLPDRGIVRVAGEDAGKLLQGIITNDIDLLASRPAIHAALLAPQGKLLFEFFVVKAADGFLLETAKNEVGDLAKRLGMYKLRAKATIEELSSSYSVAAAWGEMPAELPWDEASVDPNDDNRVVSDIHLLWFKRARDGRLKELGERWLLPTRVERELDKHSDQLEIVDAAQYHAHRISLGVPEGGKDYAFGDSFPHEANLDVLGSVSFTKGCFVGQEVVSRMQHRGSARKRIVIVEGDGPLQPGSEIMAGPAAIGTIGSVAGKQGLALLRLDRAQEAIGKGMQLTAGGRRIVMRLPDYLESAEAATVS